jgi:hypothetical protein
MGSYLDCAVLSMLPYSELFKIACAVPCCAVLLGRFYQTHGRFPGSYDDTLEDDIPLLKSIAGQVLSDLGVSGAAVQDDTVGEMCRCAFWMQYLLAAVWMGAA